MEPESPEAAHLMSAAVDLRVFVGKLRRRLRDEAPAGHLTEPQRHVLGRLERDGPSTVTALARAEGMRSQSMGATIAALVDAGFLKATPDPKDGRQTILSLTATARKAFKAVRAAREDWLLASMQSRFSQAEQRQLMTGIELLQRLVD
ncbi:homoprotocatechuate degradation operon regulator, HpaR (plasmid) [Variovorax sp. SRS16]|nr:homoprotocatechuate degradation operon regulator, HpaR [Variovorax sp. SRS16]